MAGQNILSEEPQDYENVGVSLSPKALLLLKRSKDDMTVLALLNERSVER